MDGLEILVSIVAGVLIGKNWDKIKEVVSKKVKK